jgi:hypothetical protein
MVHLSRNVWKGEAEMMQTMFAVAFRAASNSSAALGSPWEDCALLT